MDDDEARIMFLSPENNALPSFEETWNMEPLAPCQGIAGGKVIELLFKIWENGHVFHSTCQMRMCLSSKSPTTKTSHCRSILKTYWTPAP